MEIQEYSLVNEVQEDHWWWLGRQKIIKDIIEYHIPLEESLDIADVGSGFGANLPLLTQYGNTTALELNTDALDAIQMKWGISVQTIPWKSPQPIDRKFNLMLLADVMEHIPEDRSLVQWIFDHLKEDGVALVTVPAHRFLWTQMDEVVHHVRRYERKELLELFKDSFDIVHFSFYNSTLFPVKIAFLLFDRIIRALFPKKPKRSYNDLPHPFINSLFKQILYLESPLVKRFRIPWGVSMVLLVKRKSGIKNSRPHRQT